jgi:hypothetical protein
MKINRKNYILNNIKINMKKSKKINFKLIRTAIVFTLSIFIATFFILNEKFDLGLGPGIIIPLTLILATGAMLLSKKVNISNYILLPVIIGDGYFHLTSPLENLVRNSPDWVIAFNLYGGSGMPVIVHQIMGVFLIITSLIFIFHLAMKKKNWYYPFYKYLIAIVTMTIISTSYVIKMFK